MKKETEIRDNKESRRRKENRREFELNEYHLHIKTHNAIPKKTQTICLNL
jgi:hypothetical protein